MTPGQIFLIVIVILLFVLACLFIASIVTLLGYIIDDIVALLYERMRKRMNK